MSKQQAAQKYIFKIHTDRLKKAKWKLQLTIQEARNNDEIISIGDSQMLRWIDEINGVGDNRERIREIFREIIRLRRQDSTVPNRHRIKSLYGELDKLRFKPDYMHLVVDKNRDFLRACKGFTINNVSYVRLIGTSGGVKNNTVVFVNKEIAPELIKRVNNGRNEDVPLVPAKFEAYRALTCSGSTPVSMPKGVLVVPDCITHFKEDVLYLTDENDGEPELREWNGFDVELNASDGCGMMLPSLAERWSQELKLGYTACAMNTRQSWEKGVVFAFDFVEFADKVAGTRMVTDAWGHQVDIGNVELILTTSMLKLWNCYDSIEHYLKCCEDNHYSFSITKTAPRELENRRAANYQFLQCLNMTDDQIDKLIAPTISEIRDVVYGDYRKALLFLAGRGLDDASAIQQTAHIKAMMIEPKMFDDPYIKSKIKTAISKKVDGAKIGVIDLHANYSIIGGDLYALCQSIFGLEVTGILKAGEIYNQYWRDAGAGNVVCFRAPMSTAENVRPMIVNQTEEAAHWFQYITTCTLMNSWDTCTAALNGCDFDGDILYVTDDPVILDVAPRLKTLYCAQKSAQKKIVTESDLIQSNIDGFGNEVGKVTNRVTSMYDVQAQFDPGTTEYETLAYRIRSGQLFQQNSIDKTKGIVCKPMPKYWYDYHAALDNPGEDGINIRIVADKKPRFMTYVYPVLMKEYKSFAKSTDLKSIMEFGRPISELADAPDGQTTDRQKEFLEYCRKMMPVQSNESTMNRICSAVEASVTDIKTESAKCDFDYTIIKNDSGYKKSQYYAIKKLYDAHTEKLKKIAVQHKNRAISRDAYADYQTTIIQRFKHDAETICSNQDQLCNIVLDMCYTRQSSKQFAWDVVSHAIIGNLRERAGSLMISYPIRDPNGDIEYCGERFSMRECEDDFYGDLFE